MDPSLDTSSRRPRELFESFAFSILSAHGVKPYFHRM